MTFLPGDAGSQPVRFAPRPAPVPQTPAGGAFASPVGPNVPRAAQQQAIHQAALQGPPAGGGILPGGDASRQLQELAHARIVQQYIHQVGDHSGSLFKGLWNLPPAKQVPIVKMVLRETGLGALKFNEGVEALSQHVNSLDKQQLAEMNKALTYDKSGLGPDNPPPPAQPAFHPLGTGPQGGFVLPPTGPDRGGRNGAAAQQIPIPLTQPIERVPRYLPIPPLGIRKPKSKLV